MNFHTNDRRVSEDGRPCGGLEELTLPDMAKRRTTASVERRTSIAEVLRAYPNPFNGPIFLVYTVPEGVEQVYLRMMDGLGRVVFQQRLAPQDGIAEVLPSQVANGLHIAALFYDGVRVGTVKITVSK